MAPEASEYEPNQDQLMKYFILLKEVGGKLEEKNGRDDAKKLIGLWVEMMGVVTNLISANNKIAGISISGDEGMTTFFQQNGIEKLIYIKNLRKKTAGLADKIESIGQDISKGEDHPLAPLADIGIPEAFLTELQRETMDDVCSFACAQKSRALENLVHAFTQEIHGCRMKKDPNNIENPQNDLEYFLQWAEGSKSTWGKDLPDATLQQLTERAQTTIHKIPAQSTLQFCNNVEKA